MGILLVILLAHAPSWAGMSYVTTPPPAQQPPPAVPPSVDPAVDDVAGEILRQNQQIQNAYDAINRANPLSEQFDPALAGQADPNAQDPASQVQRLLSNPMVQQMGSLAADPRFGALAMTVAAHPSRMTLAYAEIVALVAFLVFRAWRQSKAVGWKGRLWVSFYSLVIFWAVSAAVLPTLILGKPYLDMLRAIAGS